MAVSPWELRSGFESDNRADTHWRDLEGHWVGNFKAQKSATMIQGALHAAGPAAASSAVLSHCTIGDDGCDGSVVTRSYGPMPVGSSVVFLRGLRRQPMSDSSAPRPRPPGDIQCNS